MSAQTMARHPSVYHFLSSAYHFVLPDSHPFHTARAWAFGARVNEHQNRHVFRHAGIMDAYKSFASPLSSPHTFSSDLYFTRGWLFYDEKRGQTIVRPRGTRTQQEYGMEKPETVFDAETFIIDGKVSIGMPLTNSRLGLLRFKRALERQGYKARWKGWKDFDIVKDGDNFGSAYRNPYTNELMCSFTSASVDKPYQTQAARMAKERGFKSEQAGWDDMPIE